MTAPLVLSIQSRGSGNGSVSYTYNGDGKTLMLDFSDAIAIQSTWRMIYFAIKLANRYRWKNVVIVIDNPSVYRQFNLIDRLDGDRKIVTNSKGWYYRCIRAIKASGLSVVVKLNGADLQQST